MAEEGVLEAGHRDESSNALSFLFCFLYTSLIAWKMYLPVFPKLCVEFISIAKVFNRQELKFLSP